MRLTRFYDMMFLCNTDIQSAYRYASSCLRLLGYKYVYEIYLVFLFYLYLESYGIGAQSYLQDAENHSQPINQVCIFI